MKTAAAWGAFGVVVLVLGVLSPAEARGLYRGPGGQVPPGLREPTDPSPPPPPPPSNAAVAAQAVPTEPPPPPDAPVGVPSFADWRFWYHLNREAFEGPPGPRPALAPDVRARVLAAIVHACGGASPFPSALIALGRAADRVEHVEILLAALRAEPRQASVVQSAALGLGLLRRSHATEPFDAALYDRVRTALLENVLRGDRHTGGVRAFAAYALALLGDQPSASLEPTQFALLDLARAAHADHEVPIALLHALAMQETVGPPEAVLAFLREAAQGKAAAGQRGLNLLRSHALMALGRAGGESDAVLLGEVLATAENAGLRRSAATGLVHLAIRADAHGASRIVDALLRAALSDADDTVRGFALAGAAAAVVEGRGAPVVSQTLLGETLLVVARHGDAALRPYGALGLGHLLGALDLEGQPWAAKALAVLDEGIATGDVPSRAAFALGRCLASRDGETAASLAARLRELAADPTAHNLFRSYAALGLGHAAAPGKGADAVDVGPFLREQLGEPRNETHRAVLVAALGLRRDGGAVEALRTAAAVPSGLLQPEAVVALARIGTPEAVEVLLGLATSADAHPSARSLALAGLGRLLDGEPRPSLARLTLWINYRASIGALGDLFTIL